MSPPANPTNVVQLRTHPPFVVHEGPKPDYVKTVRSDPARDLTVDYSPLDSFGDEHPEPVHGPSLCAGMVLGAVVGLLAIAVPAIVLARVVYGAWL